MKRIGILVIRPGALGDTVLTEPVVASLRAAYPEARIELAGRTDFLPLLVGPGRADACRSMDGPQLTSLFSDGPVALPACDVAIAYLPDADGALAVRLAAHAERSVVFDPRPLERGGVHICEHLLSALKPLGVAPLRSRPQLTALPAWIEAARNALGGDADCTVIHPGSGGSGKLWQAEKWAAVIAGLRPLPVVLTCGPADAETVAELLAQADRTDIRVLRDCPATTLAGALAGARLYLGCDSGVTHLAAALGVPTVALFGPTDPRVWAPRVCAPRGEQVRVLAGGGDTASISAESVLAASADLDAGHV